MFNSFNKVNNQNKTLCIDIFNIPRELLFNDKNLQLTHTYN